MFELMLASGTAERLDPEKRPNSLPRAVRPRATSRASRTAPSSAPRRPEDAGPTNNWRDPTEMRATLRGLFARLDARPHALRRALQHGPARLAHRAHRRPALGLALRGREHAHHDAHGAARCSTCSASTATSCRACTRSAIRSRDGQPDVAVAVRRREQVHRALPGDARDLELRLGLRRQRAARQEVLRAAHRLDDGARRGLARRAHADPEAHLAGRARSATSRPRSRARAARRISRCSSPPSRAGRSRRSATTSPG